MPVSFGGAPAPTSTTQRRSLMRYAEKASSWDAISTLAVAGLVPTSSSTGPRAGHSDGERCHVHHVENIAIPDGRHVFPIKE
eukprot:6263668-Pyramimonas_sp.AAC.1